MNPTLEIVGTLSGILFAAITVYGSVTRTRSWFTLGICFFSTIPIIGEALNYAQDDNLMHLSIIMAYLVQVVICLPISVNYGSENLAAIALAQKIGVAILVANLCTGYLILSTKLGVPHKFGYLHLVVAMIMLYTVVRSSIQKEVRWR